MNKLMQSLHGFETPKTQSDGWFNDQKRIATANTNFYMACMREDGYSELKALEAYVKMSNKVISDK